MKGYERPAEPASDDDCNEIESNETQDSSDVEEAAFATTGTARKELSVSGTRGRSILMTHGPTVVVGGAIIMLAMLSLSQKRQLETQGKLLTDWEDVIDSQNSLIKQLASDGLRHGSSLAGKCMAGLRE